MTTPAAPAAPAAPSTGSVTATQIAVVAAVAAVVFLLLSAAQRALAERSRARAAARPPTKPEA